MRGAEGSFPSPFYGYSLPPPAVVVAAVVVMNSKSHSHSGTTTARSSATAQENHGDLLPEAVPLVIDPPLPADQGVLSVRGPGALLFGRDPEAPSVTD